ncbi:MAG: endonuclease V [Candidatus Zixiibacteriota bacterium]|nr:MAG: endonuclease V [candidate division Zixibacteria bacterium]
MNLVYEHPWPTNKRDAFPIRDEALGKIVIKSTDIEPKTIAAVDAAYGYAGSVVYASAVAVTLPDMTVVERSGAFYAVAFPYHPGMFYFREGRTVIEALAGLECDPDLIMVARHGIAHPRRCGMACHVGIAFDKPTIGCARKLLAGTHNLLDSAEGSSDSIMLDNKEVGIAYRSRENVKPIYISPAHRCDITFARETVISCLQGNRQPEPLRLAHLFANKLKRAKEKNRPSSGRQSTPKS